MPCNNYYGFVSKDFKGYLQRQCIDNCGFLPDTIVRQLRRLISRQEKSREYHCKLFVTQNCGRC